MLIRIEMGFEVVSEAQAKEVSARLLAFGQDLKDQGLVTAQDNVTHSDTGFVIVPE
jgi:hypothetical protein